MKPLLALAVRVEPPGDVADALALCFGRGGDPIFETRVVALLANGQIVTGNGSSVNDQSEWRFAKTPLGSIAKFQLQARPIVWVEFRGVRLAPVALEK